MAVKKKREPNKGSFVPGQDKPKRGKAFKTKLLDVIKQEAKNELGKSLGLNRYKKSNITNELIENAVIKNMAIRAFDNSDPASGALLKEFLGRIYPLTKAMMPTITFEFPKGDKITDEDKANAVLKAVSEGDLPPDAGSMLFKMLSDIQDIREKSELIERLEKLEAFIESLLNKEQNGATS